MTWEVTPDIFPIARFPYTIASVYARTIADWSMVSAYKDRKNPASQISIMDGVIIYATMEVTRCPCC